MVQIILKATFWVQTSIDLLAILVGPLYLSEVESIAEGSLLIRPKSLSTMYGTLSVGLWKILAATVPKGMTDMPAEDSESHHIGKEGHLDAQRSIGHMDTIGYGRACGNSKAINTKSKDMQSDNRVGLGNISMVILLVILPRCFAL